MRQQTRFIQSTTFSLLLCACMLLLTEFAQADTNRLSAEDQAKLYPETTRYTIRRKGKRVGEHTVSFKQDANGLSVSVESNITVRVLKVPVYRFNYTANEYWQDGKLMSVQARTDRAGDVTRVKFIPDSASQSSNHWNPAVLDTDTVFNTITGNISNVSIDLIGSETLTSAAESIQTTQYRYSGDIQADVWYDENHRWVKLKFKGDDGSEITYTANPLVLSR